MKKLLSTIAVATLSVSVASAYSFEDDKAYIGFDLGYKFSKTGTKPLAYRDSERLHGFAGTAAFGYNIFNNVRTDFTLNYSQPKKTRNLSWEPAEDGARTRSDEVKFKEKILTAMFNAYYDFKMDSDFVPYVMAGVGYGRSKLDLTITDTVTTINNGNATTQTNITYPKSKTSNDFAYQLGFGVGYEISKDVFMDIGYKLSGLSGKYKAKETFTFAKSAAVADNNIIINKGEKMASSKLKQSLMLGVRFAL
jgi:opacity protein-like surface antigen